MSEHQSSPEFDEWAAVWEQRQHALEQLLGPAQPNEYHGEPPIWKKKGRADVLWFAVRPNLHLYVTADLTGPFFTDQPPSTLGRYELMIATREPNDWAPTLISVWAYETLHQKIEPGNTLDLAGFITRRFPDSCIESAICCQPPTLPGAFTYAGETFGLLTLVGISENERSFLRREGQWAFIERLESAGVFPYTDPTRASTTR